MSKTSGDSKEPRSAEDIINEAGEVARLKRDRDQSRSRIRELEAALALAHSRESFTERLADGFQAVENTLSPPWAYIKKPTGLHHGTPGTISSDQHFDEVIRPEEVEGRNCYNREIATLRLKEHFKRTVRVAREYITGVKYEGFLLELLGDTFSGNIHEELIRTNEDSVFGSLKYWLKEMESFIGGLADEFGKLHVVGVVGNHGRMTRKPIAKGRARDNCDWFLYEMLREMFRKDDRITWNIPESTDASTTFYGTTILSTHGDQARGGSGISGKHTPIALMEHRKAKRAMTMGAPFQALHQGHWHEYTPGRILTNGSLKGIDEYAYTNNFGMEPPAQAFFLITPEHGISLHAPLFCAADRKKEQW